MTRHSPSLRRTNPKKDSQMVRSPACVNTPVEAGCQYAASASSVLSDKWTEGVCVCVCVCVCGGGGGLKADQEINNLTKTPKTYTQTGRGRQTEWI